MAKKSFDAQLNVCKALKTKCLAAQSQAAETLKAIKENNAWDFGLGYQAECNEYQMQLDALKNSSKFWQSWSTSSWQIFAAWVKKNYSMPETQKELKLMPQVDTAVGNIAQWNAKLQRMYAASLNHD